MSRTTKYKLFYTTLFFVGCLGAPVAFLHVRLSPPAVIAAVLLFLAPGRVQGFFYRDFHRGRHLMTQEQVALAIPHFEAFLLKLEQAPWLQRLSFLGASVYTRDIKAMTFNNLGACILRTGSLEEARYWLERAIERDKLYPPYYNLALVEQLANNETLAEFLLEQAQYLGLSYSFVDTFLQKASELLSRVEGRS
jgi:tetratricopeptide (TPR) repeat protein